jgi:hypothetical protein
MFIGSRPGAMSILPGSSVLCGNTWMLSTGAYSIIDRAGLVVCAKITVRVQIANFTLPDAVPSSGSFFQFQTI